MKSFFKKDISGLFVLSLIAFCNDGYSTEEYRENYQRTPLSFGSILLDRILSTPEQHLESLQRIFEKQYEKPHVVVVVNASGKTQAVVANKFAAKLEQEMSTKLSSVVDRFIGLGSGAIVAGAASIGDNFLKSKTQIIESLPSKLLLSTNSQRCCAIFGCVKSTVDIVVSAYSDNAQILEDSDIDELVKLEYDSILTEQCKAQLQQLYGQHTLDGRTNLRIVTKSENKLISELVRMANIEKDASSRARIKKISCDEVLNTVGDALNIIGEVGEIEEVKAVGKTLVKLSGKPGISAYPSTKELKAESLQLRKALKKDLIILNINTDTTDGNRVDTRSSFDTEQTGSGRNIVTLNYHIGIPKSMYHPAASESAIFSVLLDTAINSFFQGSAGKEPLPMNLLVDLLTQHANNSLVLIE